MHSGKQTKENSRGSPFPWLASGFFPPWQVAQRSGFARLPFEFEAWFGPGAGGVSAAAGECPNTESGLGWWVKGVNPRGLAPPGQHSQSWPYHQQIPVLLWNPWPQEICFWPLRSWEDCMAPFLDEFHPCFKIKSWCKKIYHYPSPWQLESTKLSPEQGTTLIPGIKNRKIHQKEKCC